MDYYTDPFNERHWKFSRVSQEAEWERREPPIFNPTAGRLMFVASLVFVFVLTIRVFF